MEKVKITKLELQELNDFRHNRKTLRDFINDSEFYRPLSRFTPEQFSLLLNDWYEIEPEFKEKEWMIWKSRIVQIVWINESKRICCISLPKRKEKAVSIDSIERHATPEEIKQEKERRWWAKHGREPWELKQDDVLYRKDDDFLVIVDGIHTSPNDEKTVIYKGGDWEYFKNVIDEFKVICFAENRLDLSN